MIFFTLNSSYEIEGNCIRFLEGSFPPHHLLEPAGSWHEFEWCSEVVVGEPVTSRIYGKHGIKTTRVTSAGVSDHHRTEDQLATAV